MTNYKKKHTKGQKTTKFQTKKKYNVFDTISPSIFL